MLILPFNFSTFLLFYLLSTVSDCPAPLASASLPATAASRVLDKRHLLMIILQPVPGGNKSVRKFPASDTVA
jgi:hypothetical protein